jgi:hypothetical protein
MAGPRQNRAQAEKPPQGSSQGSSSASRDPTQRSLKSIPRLDGNRDPGALAPIEYTVPTDLKNISEFLGLAGWYAARGVSTNAPLSQPAYACTFASKHSQLHCLRMQAGFSPLIRKAEPLDAYKNPPPHPISFYYTLITIISFRSLPHFQHPTFVHHLYYSFSPLPSS